MRRLFLVITAILLPVIVFSANNERAEIKPLLKSEWSGGTPYNATVKEITGLNEPGCTPVALSQVLYYYKYPEKALRNGRYKTPDGMIKDYPMAEIPFRWDLMKDSYNESDDPDSDSSRAVADLMFATTLTLPMNHSINSYPDGPLYNGEEVALEYYFGYNDAVMHLSHDYFDSDTWSDIIYYELSQGRPVMFSGHHPQSGHSFICDGYKDGYFHFNWGWGYGGEYLDLETFRTQDNPLIDGSYKFGTSITVLIQPGNIKEKPTNPYIKYNPLLKIISDFGKTFEYEKESIYDFSGDIGLKVISEQGEISYVEIESISMKDNLSKKCDINMNLLSNLKDGNYSVYPVYRKQGESGWLDMMVPLKNIKSLSFNIKNSKVTLLESPKPEYYYDVKISEFRPTSTVFDNSVVQFAFKGVNSGNIPYYEMSNIKIYSTDNADKYIRTFGAWLAFHNKEENDYIQNITVGLQPGRYFMVIEDSKGKLLSDRIALDVYSRDDIFTVDNINYLQLYDSDCVRVLPRNDFEYSGTLIVPDVIEYKGKKLKVTEVDGEAFSSQQKVDAIVFSENVKKIGRSAVPYNFKVVILSPDLEIDQQLSIGSVEVFVPDANYDKISKVLDGLKSGFNRLFTLSNDITLSNVPESLETPAEVKISFDSSHPYTDLNIQFEPGNCISYQTYIDENDNYTLRLNPQNPGNCTVTVSSLQPYKPISKRFIVKCLELSGIDVNEKDIYNDISVLGNVLRILNPAANVLVSDVSGKSYPVNSISDSEIIFYAPAPGIYIINIGKKAFKILMNF